MTQRAEDYIALGVPETWILDPETKRAFVHSAAGLHQVAANGMLVCGKIQLDLAALFAQL